MQASQLTTSPGAAQALHAVGFTEHLAFFDDDGDHAISLQETQRGLERLGFGHLISGPGALVIHASVSGLGFLRGQVHSLTQLGIESVGFLRHPDTALVDAKGNFHSARLDEVFAKYARRFPGEALTVPELIRMATTRLLREGGGLRELLLLPAGAASLIVEWGALLWVAGGLREGRRVLEKQTVQRFYTDPQFFHDVAKHIALLREERAERLLGRVRNFVQAWVL